ncbi:MAG: hypothetical protein Q7U78_07560 [Gallionella sp.]|nr:hypothetical protein [Gallionella sp.]
MTGMELIVIAVLIGLIPGNNLDKAKYWFQLASDEGYSEQPSS